jgi:hypothetical protein
LDGGYVFFILQMIDTNAARVGVSPICEEDHRLFPLRRNGERRCNNSSGPILSVFDDIIDRKAIEDRRVAHVLGGD